MRVSAGLRRFAGNAILTLVAACCLLPIVGRAATAADDATRPNILFAIADDWGWPHAGVYGDAVVKTPAFDRLAREGVLFNHTYVSSPSCTPSRGAILTGQWHWRLEAAGNLYGTFPDKFDVYPELLARAGYDTGASGKGWGPGRPQTQSRQLAGKRFRNFQTFLQQRTKGKPFCYWLGTSDPHRPYKRGSGAAAGMDLDRVHLFGCFPDHPDVRGDVADYYFEVQRFDRLVGDAIKSLEAIGELDNTIVLMTGDNGMPFPRCKGNLYDSGVRMPLAIRWPAKAKGGRTVDDFVSFTDFAPTFLEAAGLKPAAEMTGRSLLGLLTGGQSGRVDPARDHVLVGKERHCPGQEDPDMGGYPCRAIRTHEYLYIRNFAPDRWPAGTPNHQQATMRGAWYGDCDNSPTKTYMVDNRDKDATHRKLYDAAFGKRPAEELYDLKKDPEQLENVAGESAYAEIRERLSKQLTDQLRATADPRIIGGGEQFDRYPYSGGVPKYPGPKK
ncbi:MAG: sulfatase [Candidatus Nealsonbacteria bacterium]|nr:sulfatase [Candidatus Nealsonbacteria bacterium]